MVRSWEPALKTLVKLEDGVLQTLPWQERDPEESPRKWDKALRQAPADEQERSEHNMLVDLGWNDRQDQPDRHRGSGKVYVHRALLSRDAHRFYSEGRDQGDADALDAVECRSFPQEPCREHRSFGPVRSSTNWKTIKRGIYGGAIGYISFTGNLDTCIAIRLAFSKNGKVFVDPVPVLWRTVYRRRNTGNAFRRQQL